MKQPFDLYKWIIIGSLVLMPVAGGWLYWLNKQIAFGQKAIAAATDRKGEIETIGQLLQEIDNQARSASAATTEDPEVYFDRQISRSSKDLKRNDYKIDYASGLKHNETKSIDKVYKVEFRRDNKQFALTRELVQAVLFNIEANSPAWRLRSLFLRNEESGEKQLRMSGKKPPPELPDTWFVDKMEFARREPDPGARRR
ncbi:MAG: hypothetical protein R3F56_12430 [Planctomycetota bacterium]